MKTEVGGRMNYGDVSKKLIPREKAWRTEAMASDSETTPKTLPRGEAPKPTQLSLSPVLPNGRRSSGVAAILDVKRERERS